MTKNVGKWSLLYFLPSAYVSKKVGSTTLNPMHIWFYLLFGQSQVGRGIESAATLYLFENRETVVDEIKRLRKNFGQFLCMESRKHKKPNEICNFLYWSYVFGVYFP